MKKSRLAIFEKSISIFILVIIIFLIMGIIYGLLTANGNLAFAFIIGLIFFSICSYFVIWLHKSRIKRMKMDEEIHKYANKNTKKINKR